MGEAVKVGQSGNEFRENLRTAFGHGIGLAAVARAVGAGGEGGAQHADGAHREARRRVESHIRLTGIFR